MLISSFSLNFFHFAYQINEPLASQSVPQTASKANCKVTYDVGLRSLGNKMRGGEDQWVTAAST
ncbi:hypothetical protein LMG24076_02543 [Trinickia soli]|nr:hypothetical protein LMG24076_02543 [Trinickia soli]